MSVQVDTTEKGHGREFFELIGSSQVISERYLSDTADVSKVIQWSIDYDRRVIKDGSVVIFAEPDQLDEKMILKETAAQHTLARVPALAAAEDAPPLENARQPYLRSEERRPGNTTQR